MIFMYYSYRNGVFLTGLYLRNCWFEIQYPLQVDNRKPKNTSCGLPILILVSSLLSLSPSLFLSSASSHFSLRSLSLLYLVILSFIFIYINGQ